MSPLSRGAPYNTRETRAWGAAAGAAGAVDGAACDPTYGGAYCVFRSFVSKVSLCLLFSDLATDKCSGKSSESNDASFELSRSSLTFSSHSGVKIKSSAFQFDGRETTRGARARRT